METLSKLTMKKSLQFLVSCASDAIRHREAKAAAEAKAAKAAKAEVVSSDSECESEGQDDDAVVDCDLMKLLKANNLEHLEMYLEEGKLSYDVLYQAWEGGTLKTKLKRAGIENDEDHTAMKSLFKNNKWERCSVCNKGEFRKTDDVFMCKKCTKKA